MIVWFLHVSLIIYLCVYFLARCISSLPHPLLCFFVVVFYLVAVCCKSTIMQKRVSHCTLYSPACIILSPFFASVVLLVLVCWFQVPCLLVRWKIPPAFWPWLCLQVRVLKDVGVWVGVRCVGLTLRWWYGLFLEAWSLASWSWRGEYCPFSAVHLVLCVAEYIGALCMKCLSHLKYVCMFWHWRGWGG